MSSKIRSTSAAFLALLLAGAAHAADAPAAAPATTTAAAPSAAPAADAAALPNGGKRKPCDELRAEIAGRMDAKGVQGYALRVVTYAEAETATGEKVVGSCDGGTMKILYKRG